MAQIIWPTAGPFWSQQAILLMSAFLVPAVVSAICATAILKLPNAPRIAMYSLLAVAVLTCAYTVYTGWSLLVVPLAVPTIFLALAVSGARA